MNTLITGGMHQSWKRTTARITAQGLSGRALDVASGTGDLALALAGLPQIHQAVGLDLLPEMITLAQAKAAREHPAAQTCMMLGDALSLPFPDNSFACATAGFSLRNMPDLPRALAEMSRVVKPGGRVTTLELTPLTRGLKSRLFRPYFHGLVPLMGQLVAGNRAAYSYLPQSVDRFPDAEGLSSLLREAGLVEVDYQFLGFGTVALHRGTQADPLRLPKWHAIVLAAEAGAPCSSVTIGIHWRIPKGVLRLSRYY